MAEALQEGYVTMSSEQQIVTIEFFHPQRNSLPAKLLADLAKAIQLAGADEACKVIFLRSGGEKIFCAGASFDELSAIKTKEQGLEFFLGFSAVINAMRQAGKFIVARIHGKCIGGGVGLAAAADYAIAVEGADVKLSELAVGIGPFVVGPAVERKIGLSAFSQLAIDAAMWRNADWARRKGLYAELHNDLAGMDDSIRRLLNTLSQSNAAAMQEMKKVFWAGTENWNQLLAERAAISGRLILSEESQNFIHQFKTAKQAK